MRKRGVSEASGDGEASEASGEGEEGKIYPKASNNKQQTMPIRQDTLWEQFLQPIVNILIDEEEIERSRNAIDWDKVADRFVPPDFVYPEYYRSQNFHGIEGGYLTVSAAITYDPITRYALPPNETWVREEAIAAIGGQPRRILDLGCGTGSMALMLKQTFPNARITGLDLSPYMLAMAEYNAAQKGLELEWQQGKAETTNFPENEFDLIAIALLFHETPAEITRAILRESWRLLASGGQIVILDGNQKTLRQTDWLNNIFEEPYIRDYARESLEASLGATGFVSVQTQEIWGIHQVTIARKALLARDTPSGNAARSPIHCQGI